MKKLYHQVKSLLRPYYHRLTRNLNFEVEKAMIAGTHHTRSQQPSVLHFSLNKAATQHVKYLLWEMCKPNKLTMVSLNELAWASQLPYMDHLSSRELEAYQYLFKPKGYIYSVFGGMIAHIDQLEQYKIVFTIRDPRDILVSGYFSAAFSHPPPPDGSNKLAAFEARRARARSMGIDAWVLQEAMALQNILMRYQTLLMDKVPGLQPITYETMTTDFDTWVFEVLQAADWTIGPKTWRKLYREQALRQPKAENVQEHRRKGKPGDHREKLKPDTIIQLNSLFALIPFVQKIYLEKEFIKN